MPELFLKIFNASVSVSWLILAIIIIRPFLKKWSSEMICLLWLLVVARLLLPFDIKSHWSLVPSSETISERVAKFDHYPTINSGLQVVDQAINPTLSRVMEARVDNSVNPLYVWVAIASYIWGVGVLVLTVYTIISSWLFQRRLLGAKHLANNVYTHETLTTPFVFGLLRPKIYLPTNLLEVQQEFVVAHEREHLHHADNWWKFAGFALAIIHWFNPLVWLAFVLFGHDLETACDARVIKKLEFAKRQKYAETLVDVSTVKPNFALSAPLAFAEGSVKNRVQQILDYKRPTFWMITGGMVICAMAAVCFLTNPPRRDYTVEVFVPAHSGENIYWTDEEIKVASRQIGIEALGGDDPTELYDLTLLPVDLSGESQQENIVHLNSRLPARFSLNRDHWWRVGLRVSNPTDTDQTMTLHLSGVTLRISSQATSVPAITVATDIWNDTAYHDVLLNFTSRDLGNYLALTWEEQTYVPYIAIDRGERGRLIGQVDGDESQSVYLWSRYPTSGWVITCDGSGLMEGCMLWRESSNWDLPAELTSEYEWNQNLW